MNYERTGQPIDILLSNLDFLHEYLEGLAAKLRDKGDEEEADIAAGWASLPLEASDAISSLIEHRNSRS